MFSAHNSKKSPSCLQNNAPLAYLFFQTGDEVCMCMCPSVSICVSFSVSIGVSQSVSVTMCVCVHQSVSVCVCMCAPLEVLNFTEKLYQSCWNVLFSSLLFCLCLIGSDENCGNRKKS